MRGTLSLALPFGMQHDYASPQVSRSSVSLCLEWETHVSHASLECMDKQ